ncbi:hypothetical protein GCM10027064_15020 [Microbacterium petrolearium]
MTPGATALNMPMPASFGRRPCQPVAPPCASREDRGMEKDVDRRPMRFAFGAWITIVTVGLALMILIPALGR